MFYYLILVIVVATCTKDELYERVDQKGQLIRILFIKVILIISRYEMLWNLNKRRTDSNILLYLIRNRTEANGFGFLLCGSCCGNLTYIPNRIAVLKKSKLGYSLQFFFIDNIVPFQRASKRELYLNSYPLKTAIGWGEESMSIIQKHTQLIKTEAKRLGFLLCGSYCGNLTYIPNHIVLPNKSKPILLKVTNIIDILDY